MIKYEMMINKKPYNALFRDHSEAFMFIGENELDGEDIVYVRHTEITTVNEILDDDDFGYSYKIEMIGIMLGLNEFHFKWDEMEYVLKEMGVI